MTKRSLSSKHFLLTHSFPRYSIINSVFDYNRICKTITGNSHKKSEEMSDQEVSFLQQLHEEDSICRSMHHLSTVSDRHHPSAAVPHTIVPDTYTTAGGNSAKRQSPLFQSLLEEPISKRATLYPSSSPSTAAADHDLFGFTKLPLPQSFPAASPPLLRRTLSEPIYSPVTVNSTAQPPQSSEFPTSPDPLKTQPRQEISNGNVSQESFPIPETAPASAPLLYRTVSDPNPFFNRQLVPAAGTPPRPPASARRIPSTSPSCGESPSARRLRRMKERLREMSQWWTQVASEEDDDDNDESETYCIHNNPKEESENLGENPSQEAVFVEKAGDCLVLHFKCPCGDGYQILLSGNNCYYKLTNFRNC